MTRGRRAAIRVLLLGALTFLLTGCLKLTMDLDVAADDTVSGTAVFAFDKDILELAGGSFDDALGGESIVPSDVEGVSVEPYEDDRFTGQEITLDAVSLEDFNQDAAGEDSLEIVREGETFRVTGVLDLAMDDVPTEGVPFDPQEMFEGADIRISLSFPGEIRSSNGEIDGNTVTWTPVVGERTELDAVASAVGGSDTNLLWIVVAVLAVGAIAAAVVVSSRRKPAPAVSGAGPVEPGTGATAPVPTADAGAVASPPPPPDVVPSQPEPTEPVPSQREPDDVVPPQPVAPPEPPPSPPSAPGEPPRA